MYFWFEPNRLYWDFSGLCFTNNKPKSAPFKVWHCGHTTPFSQQTSHYCEKCMVCFRMQEECQLCSSTACVDALKHNLGLYNGSAKKENHFITGLTAHLFCPAHSVYWHSAWCWAGVKGGDYTWGSVLLLSPDLPLRAPVQLCCSNGEERKWLLFKELLTAHT